MSFNIDSLEIEFVKDINKEYFSLSETNYTSFSPVEENLDKGRYLKLEPLRKDNKCYIKIKNKNLWLFKKNNTLSFKPLYLEDGDFYCEQPLVIWIEYLREPTFVAYISTGYGEPIIEYLNYEYSNNLLKISIVKDIFRATTFYCDHFNWHSFLAKSKDLTSGV